jgi:hypothetical protein
MTPEESAWQRLAPLLTSLAVDATSQRLVEAIRGDLLLVRAERDHAREQVEALAQILERTEQELERLRRENADLAAWIAGLVDRQGQGESRNG